jgi:hypothetical protein
VDFNDLVSCTSLGGINIRMLFLGLVIQVSIYIYIHFRCISLVFKVHFNSLLIEKLTRKIN